MKKKFNYKVLIYCFIISLVILFFTSKSSPFYPFNDWVDANAFFTVGKGIFKGIVPYKDIFEQKGPILYFIYGIASLISNTSFIGVFIIEVCSMSFTLYFCYLISCMFISSKKSIIILPIFLLLITISKSFTHGSSCEELMFLPQAISLYYFIKHFKVKHLTKKEFIINGLMAGIVLLMKYTSLGYWFAFQMLIFFSYCSDKKYKDGIKNCIWFLLGMFFPLAIILIYFGFNNAIGDFINTYFIINMTSYSDKISLISRLWKIFETFFSTLFGNQIIIIILCLLYLIIPFSLKLEKKLKINLLIIYLFTVLGVFYGMKNYTYYLLPVLFFIIITLIGIMVLIEKKFTISRINKYYYVILLVIICICTFLSYYFSNNKYYHNLKKEELFQYEFAEVLKKDPDATLVNMGFLDCGVYTMSGLLPSTYYFELQNFKYENYPNNIDAFNDYLQNKSTKYVVYIDRGKKENNFKEYLLLENYDRLLKREFYFENNNYIAYLWRVKE